MSGSKIQATQDGKQATKMIYDNGLTIGEARKKMQYSVNHSDASVVLEILKAHPSLAQEDFAYQSRKGGIFTSGNDSFLPFCLLLIMYQSDPEQFCSCSFVEILEQVLSFYPAVLQQPLSLTTSTTLCRYHQALPLHMICSAIFNTNENDKVALQLLKVVLESYPRAVVTPDAAGNVPLHYILQEPSYEFQPPHPQLLAVIQLLVETASQFDPTSSSILYQNHQGETPLLYAIAYKNAFCDEIVDYMVSNLWSALKDPINNDNHKAQRALHYWSRTPLDLKRCQKLVKVLPYIDSLTCEPSQWTWDGMILLLTSLASIQQQQDHNDYSVLKLKRLILKGVPRAFLTANHRIRRALQQLVRRGPALQQDNLLQPPFPPQKLEIHLELKNTWYDKNRCADKECLKLLSDIFHCRQEQQQQQYQVSVSLESFQLYKQSLEDFVEKAQPVRLSLHSCTIFDDPTTNNSNYNHGVAAQQAPAVMADVDAMVLDNNGNDNVNVDMTSSSFSSSSLSPNQYTSTWLKLQKLEMIFCRMSHASFDSLLHQIRHRMPHLQDLKLIFRETENFGGAVDMTPFVEDVVIANSVQHQTGRNSEIMPLSPSLETLVVDGLYVDPDFLADYATNHVHHKTYIQYYQYGQVWTQVQYSTALDHFGRGMCQNVTTDATKSALISYLEALDDFGLSSDSRTTTTSNGSSYTPIMDDNMKSMVRFGLLIESPGIWCQ